MHHRLGNAAHFGRHHWNRRRHGLENRDRQTLELGGDEIDVHQIEKRANLALRAGEGDDRGQTQGSGSLFDLRALRAVPDDHEPHRRHRTADLGRRFQPEVEALLSSEYGDGANNGDIGTETELVLKSRWVVPTKLLETGFHFRYEKLEKAFESILHY